MKKALLLLLLVGLVATLILVGCGKPAAPAGPSEIVVGGTTMLTGMGAGFGEGATFGVQAAVEDINKLGGVFVKEYNRKIPVRLIVLDNESNPVKAGTLAEDLVVGQKVNFLISPPEWPPMIAANANVAEKYKVPHVAFAGPFEPNNAVREAAGKWQYTWESGFAIGAPPEKGYFTEGKAGYAMMDVWMAYLNKFAGQTNKKVGVFASDDSDGRGWYSSFPGALKAAGLDIIGVEKELGIAPMDATDFTPIIKQWKDANVEILLGNAPGPWFGTLWRQAFSLGFKPKIVIAERAGMFYRDVVAWGGDLPWGVMALIEWVPTIKAPGIGDTTPVSLDARWRAKSGQPTHQLVGSGYSQAQILFDAIERAGTLDKEKVNAAIGKADMMTIRGRVVYDSNQFARFPICFGQWFKTNTPEKWEMKVIFSQHDFYPATGEPIFPLP